MTARVAPAPSFSATLFVLLRVARKRAFGRLARLRRLRLRHGGLASFVGPIVGFTLVALLTGALNLGAAFDLMVSVSAGERVAAKAQGYVVVEEWFAKIVADLEKTARQDPRSRARVDQLEENSIRTEASRLASADGADADAIAEKLRAVIRGSRGNKLLPGEGLGAAPIAGALPDLLGLVMLLLWSTMLVCQGEGPELDPHRPRRPMWEWLFSHPAPASAILLAEMLAPIAANPVYVTAPLFPALIYGRVYGPLDGILGGLLIGPPVAIAMACLGKAIEINVILRYPPRLRGAILGLMGWFGYASLLAFLFFAASFETIADAAARWLEPLGGWRWPPVRALVGQAADGGHSFWRGVVLCWLVAAVVIVVSVGVAVWSTRMGLAGNFSHVVVTPRVNGGARSRFGREPLHRKELLWFRRDGGAIVQVVLVPLSLAALQLYNLRQLVADAAGAWNYLCGAAILFGTYFLLILGPKSLASEGAALWISLTWPRGLESLLKAKARLWALIASGVVAIILAYAALRFPSDLASIAAVAMGWFLFARTLAEKTVTLATVASPSGEPQKLPTGLRWAAAIGTLTFAVGVLTRQWSVAIAGVVYSQLTAAAMWQNFRYRLPFLYDPWSETLPPAPTLMHAMIGISAMVEGASVLTALAIMAMGREILPLTNPLIYGLCAIITAVVLGFFLRRRGVPRSHVWLWIEPDDPDPPRPWRRLGLAGKHDVLALLALGAALGLFLGALAHGYTLLLEYWPYTGEWVENARRQMDSVPNARESYAVIAVLLAPLAEEFLFRGLLYRALDREWGGWRAILGAAAFFAIYHPLLSWAPVAALGATNAWLFKRTGRLAPAVALHMAYNATVLLT
jgi:membrane protease YdiL (CAAX protease family)